MSKRARTPNLQLLEVFIDPDYIWISDDDDGPVVSQSPKKRKGSSKGKEEYESSETENENEDDIISFPGTPPLIFDSPSTTYQQPTLKVQYLKALGVNIQTALRENMRKRGNIQNCSIVLMLMIPFLWDIIVTSFSTFGPLKITQKTWRSTQILEFQVNCQKHLVFMESMLGKSWWKVEQFLQSAESNEQLVYIGVLSLSLYHRNKHAKSGASRFPVSFRFDEKKATLRIGMAVYYETEGGNITRGSKEDHYFGVVTEKQLTQEEQQDEDEFFAGFQK